ncbi:MAG TPA: DUF6378 domain-containing protein [Gemmatimonadaceae bacterium]|nr:DUF6378 domain-containing protein [Gemmatimonadaceae bacterium]
MTTSPHRSRVYLAGPMTGYPLFNFPAFDYAAAQWRDAEWEVVSPADLTRAYWLRRFGEPFDPVCPDPAIRAGGEIYREFLREDLRAILTCDAVALLSGWRASRGVAVELSVAEAMGLAIYDAHTFAPPPSESAVQEAHRLVHGNRGADYGHPIDDYTRTGRMWGAILGIPDIDPRLCCVMMAAMKLSRETNKHKRDNLVDAAGYAECAQMVAERQEGC